MHFSKNVFLIVHYLMVNIKDSLSKYMVNIDQNKLTINPNYKKYISNKNITNNLKPFSYNFIENNMNKIEINKFSKELKLENNDTSILNKGINLHNSLFKLNFKNPDYSYIDDNDAFIINRFLKMDFLNIDKAINIYNEYEFRYNDNHGIIDLIIEYENEYKIIDYKLSNIDDSSYINQLKGYREYLTKIVNKPIKVYLYSLFKGEYKIID